jgi:hypothetical protein
MLKLASELSIPIVFYGENNTLEAIKAKLNQYRWKGNLSFNIFSDWEEFQVLSKTINEDDLLVLISARKNALSYQKYLEHIPSKLERHFNLNNKIVVFPQQNRPFYEKNQSE